MVIFDFYLREIDYMSCLSLLLTSAPFPRDMQLAFWREIDRRDKKCINFVFLPVKFQCGTKLSDE